MWSSSNCHRPAALPCSRTEVPWQERISPSPDQCRCTQRWSSWEKVVIIFKARQNTKASFTSIYPFLQLKGKTSEKEQNPGITSLWMFASLWSPASPEAFHFSKLQSSLTWCISIFLLKEENLNSVLPGRTLDLDNSLAARGRSLCSERMIEFQFLLALVRISVVEQITKVRWLTKLSIWCGLILLSMVDLIWEALLSLQSVSNVGREQRAALYIAQ